MCGRRYAATGWQGNSTGEMLRCPGSFSILSQTLPTTTAAPPAPRSLAAHCLPPAVLLPSLVLSRLPQRSAAGLPFPVSFVSLSNLASEPRPTTRASIHFHSPGLTSATHHLLFLRLCLCILICVADCSPTRLILGRGLSRCALVAARANSLNPPRLFPQTPIISTSLRPRHQKRRAN